MTAYERIDDSAQFDGKTRESHQIRYRIAREFVEDCDTVLDACCGTGYGRKILMEGLSGAHYAGCDRDPVEGVNYGDFDTGDGFGADFNRVPAFDVFVGLECIEHLTDKGVANFVALAKEANKAIIVSTPIVPNSNPHHIQQFTKEDIVLMFEGHTWKCVHYLEQNGTYGIFVFKRI